MYSSEVGGCFWDLGFLKEWTVFILHFQRLADKHNQKSEHKCGFPESSNDEAHLSHHSEQLWADLCQHIHCQALSRWTAPVIAWPIKRPRGEWLHAAIWSRLKDQNRDLRACVNRYDVLTAAGVSQRQRPGSQLLAIVFPSSWHVERGALCGYGCPRRRTFSQTHTGSSESTSDFNLAPIIVVWKWYRESRTDSWTC